MSMDIIARGLAVKNKNDIQTNSADIAAITNNGEIKGFKLSYFDFPASGENGMVLLKVAEPNTGYFFNYDASKISAADGTAIESLADQSVNGNDLVYLGGSPDYRMEGLNGKPSIQFVTSNGDGLSKTEFSLGSITEFAYFFVCKFDTASSEMTLLSVGTYGTDTAAAAKILFYRDNASGEIRARINYNTASTVKLTSAQYDGTPMLLSVRYNGTNQRLYKNGVLMSTAAYTEAVGEHDSIAIGRVLRSDVTRGWNGHISQVKFFKSALSDQAFADENNYLMAKWGIS